MLQQKRNEYQRSNAPLTTRQRLTVGIVLTVSLVAGVILSILPAEVANRITLIVSVPLMSLMILQLGVSALHWYRKHEYGMAVLKILLLIFLFLGLLGEMGKLTG